MTTAQKDRRMVQHLPIKNEALSSNLSTAKKKKSTKIDSDDNCTSVNKLDCILQMTTWYVNYTFSFFNFYFFIIHMCVQCLGHFSPLPPPPPLPPTPPTPSPPYPLDTQQKLFCPYF
jgi:hypothetical protein